MASKDSDTRKAAGSTRRPGTQGDKRSDDDARSTRPKRADGDREKTPRSSETDSVIVRPPGTTY